MNDCRIPLSVVINFSCWYCFAPNEIQFEMAFLNVTRPNAGHRLTHLLDSLTMSNQLFNRFSVCVCQHVCVRKNKPVDY